MSHKAKQYTAFTVGLTSLILLLGIKSNLNSKYLQIAYDGNEVLTTLLQFLSSGAIAGLLIDKLEDFNDGKN